jgi:endonuclease/exonuclease/phosphatase family metal-dependent hydrolase
VILPLRLATFNLWFASRLDRALAVAVDEPRLADADFLALQEVDAEAAHTMADRLGRAAVYHAAFRHSRTGRDFGPALLSRWPILEHRRLDLPHHGLHGRPRIAIAASVAVRGQTVTVYVVHFGTMREMLPSHQTAQAHAVLADAAQRPGPAVVAGDLNRRGLGRLFEANGWRWLTRDVGRTHWFWSFDHVFVRRVRARHRWGGDARGLDSRRAHGERSPRGVG